MKSFHILGQVPEQSYVQKGGKIQEKLLGKGSCLELGLERIVEVPQMDEGKECVPGKGNSMRNSVGWSLDW